MTGIALKIGSKLSLMKTVNLI